MTASQGRSTLVIAVTRVAVCVASLLLCLAPAWPHEPDWKERGWILLQQYGLHDDDNHVLVDPARIADDSIYWNAISHVCYPGLRCYVYFYDDIDVVPKRTSFNNEFIRNGLGVFYYNPEKGKNYLILSCRIRNSDECFGKSE